MNDKISVIVPVYNVENYLSKCVESILAQTYKNIEIILVDDGSTDNSGKICDIFSQQDDRIKVIHKKNGGVSDARNMALDVATGNYLSFVDGDDFIAEDMLEVLYLNMLQNEAQVAVCHIIHSEDLNYKFENKSNKVTIYDRCEAIKAIYTDTNFWCYPCNKMYKKSLFDGIRFPTGKVYEDSFTTYKLLWKCDKVAYTERELYFYYKRPGSITESEFEESSLSVFEALDESIELFSRECIELCPIIKNYWANKYISRLCKATKVNHKTDWFKKNYKKFKKYSNGYINNRLYPRGYRLYCLLLRINLYLFIIAFKIKSRI